MDRGIDVAERELIGRKLTGGVNVSVAQEERQLRSGEGGVDPREGEASRLRHRRRRSSWW